MNDDVGTSMCATSLVHRPLMKGLPLWDYYGLPLWEALKATEISP